MRVFLLDACVRQNNEVRLLLLDEQGEKCLVSCAAVKRIAHAVPVESVTADWIEHVLFLLQKYSGGMRRDFAHTVVKRRYMTTSGTLTEPIEMLRVECSGHLSYSQSNSDRVLTFFGLTSPLLEHVLVEHELRGWLEFDVESPSVTQQHRKVFLTSDIGTCLRRHTEQSPPPPFCVAVVFRRGIDTFAYATRDGRRGDWLDAEELAERLTAIDPAAICAHGKHVLVGVHLMIPFVLVDTASFARENGLCYTKELNDAIPVQPTTPSPIDNDGLEMEYCDDDNDCVLPVNASERCAAIFSIVDRTNAIDLTLEVAAITGQPWSQTLRLESKLGRVEWMIMNFFRQSDCVIPNPRRYSPPRQYTAGLVLDAEVGVHENVVLLDFRSLYPSVVVEYKLCWSAEGAILPRMLDYLIERRKQLADVPGTEIARLCLKLLANTTYGALAFPAFRFYSPDIAETITARGRAALRDTVTVVETRFPCKVIYGDTDSVFVVTHGDDAPSDTARAIVAAVNANYTKLELEFEALYDRLLLLGKKCYVAYKGEKTVVKGLMVVKKHYFTAGKRLCYELIEALRVANGAAAVFDDLYAKTQRLVDDLRETRVRRCDLAIVNKLKRRPADYTHTAGMYHVLAALASRGNYERGDYVQYVMFDGCVPVALEMIDELPPTPVDAKWYCVRLHGMIEQIMRVFPDYNDEPFSQLLLHGDLREVEVEDVEYAPRERQPLVVACVVCKRDVEHWGLAKLESRLMRDKCDTISHLSPRCLFPEHPLSGKAFLECAACGCRFDLLAAAKQVTDADHAASLHANYDCLRVARQIDCRACRRNALHFFRSTDVQSNFDAIRGLLFTW